MLSPKQFAAPYEPPLIGGTSNVTGSGVNAINGQGLGTPGLWAQQRRKKLIEGLRDTSTPFTQTLGMQLSGFPLQEEDENAPA